MDGTMEELNQLIERAKQLGGDHGQEKHDAEE
jgi:hypothetical protein